MAGGAVDTTGGKKGKKPLDATINVVPFIDLLSCCISFLLITAVWTQVSRLQVAQAGGPPQQQQPPKNTIDLSLLVTSTGFSLVLPGTNVDIPKTPTGGYDFKSLDDKLKTVKTSLPEQRSITVKPEDSVEFNDLVTTVDHCVGDQLPDVSVSAAMN